MKMFNEFKQQHKLNRKPDCVETLSLSPKHFLLLLLLQALTAIINSGSVNKTVSSSFFSPQQSNKKDYVTIF